MSGNPLCKLYLLSYAGHTSPNYDSSALAGGTWIEVGHFSLAKCKEFAAQIGVQTAAGHGFPEIANPQFTVAAVWIPISSDP